MHNDSTCETGTVKAATRGPLLLVVGTRVLHGDSKALLHRATRATKVCRLQVFPCQLLWKKVGCRWNLWKDGLKKLKCRLFKCFVGSRNQLSFWDPRTLAPNDVCLNPLSSSWLSSLSYSPREPFQCS